MGLRGSALGPAWSIGATSSFECRKPYWSMTLAALRSWLASSAVGNVSNDMIEAMPALVEV